MGHAQAGQWSAPNMGMAYNGQWPAVTDVQWVFVPFYQNNIGVTSQRSTVHKWDDGSTTTHVTGAAAVAAPTARAKGGD
ncbi:Hypothetical predicted protein [Mytilus galloprovincialis]|uniref:Uncharacterized protein n=1 Tax=Mytilus galloprovincialis TaxID=29158 RepID=A0A8B6DTB2_MYTGA|nr:Hypothetical predicted protein [Mytilus galloprovincialis]